MLTYANVTKHAEDEKKINCKCMTVFLTHTQLMYNFILTSAEHIHSILEYSAMITLYINRAVLCTVQSQ